MVREKQYYERRIQPLSISLVSRPNVSSFVHCRKSQLPPLKKDKSHEFYSLTSTSNANVKIYQQAKNLRYKPYGKKIVGSNIIFFRELQLRIELRSQDYKSSVITFILLKLKTFFYFIPLLITDNYSGIHQVLRLLKRRQRLIRTSILL